MSKRRIQNDLDALEADRLAELSAAERLPLFIEAMAAGNEAWLETLRETAPMETISVTDPAYRERGMGALLLLHRAAYDLHTTVLQYESVLDAHCRELSQALKTRGEAAAGKQAAGQLRAATLEFLYADLYSHYHAYRRFATESLGVDLETWFATHPDGDHILASTTRVLDDPGVGSPVTAAPDPPAAASDDEEPADATPHDEDSETNTTDDADDADREVDPVALLEELTGRTPDDPPPLEELADTGVLEALTGHMTEDRPSLEAWTQRKYDALEAYWETMHADVTK